MLTHRDWYFYLYSQRTIMTDKTFNNEQKLKLTQLINEGMAVLHEVETLNGGLADTIKAVAEELEIKPNVLKKAIRLAHKAEFGKEQQDHALLENIMTTVGKTL
jgi:transposase-like protein